MNALVPSAIAHHAIGSMESRGIKTWVVGRGEAPIVPFEDENILVERISEIELQSTTPAKVWSYVQAFKDTGTPYECFLIVHDKRSLAESMGVPKVVVDTVPRVWGAVKTILVALGVILAVIAVVAAALYLVALILFPLALVAVLAGILASGDPAIVAVLPTGEWLLVARYDDVRRE
jgi:hypothetical protein